MGKLLVVVGGALFAVFLFLWSTSAQRATYAEKDLGEYGERSAASWSSSAELNLALAIFGLIIAAGGIIVDRSEGEAGGKQRRP